MDVREEFSETAVVKAIQRIRKQRIPALPDVFADLSAWMKEYSHASTIYLGEAVSGRDHALLFGTAQMILHLDTVEELHIEQEMDEVCDYLTILFIA